MTTEWQGSVRRGDLTPAEIAVLDQNGSLAAAELDILLGLVKEHDESHCQDWFCCTVELRDRLEHVGLSEAHILLRIAMQRLNARG